MKKLLLYILINLAPVMAYASDASGFFYKNLTAIMQTIPRNEKFVALTFDDGPSITTPHILEILQKYQAKATFFMLGQQVRKNALLVRRVLEAGHEIGNHSYSHGRLTRRNIDDVKKELELTQQILKEFSAEVRWFRPPYGSFNDQILAKALDLGLYTVTWNVDSEDWKAGSQVDMKNLVVKNVKPGCVVLFHDTKKSTIEALPEIIEDLHKEGYILVTMSEWLERIRKYAP